MFDWTLPENHAIAILKRDHDIVKSLFDDFDKAKTAAAKEKIIARALNELKVHAVLEEEMFYPAVRTQVGNKLMNEADEEHHVAKVLIAELDHGTRKNDHRDAKFTVLAESVRHHIKEEEHEMLPKARKVDIDFEALGQRMLDRKSVLQKAGVPKDAEHMMVARARGKGDSPAVAARRKGAASRRGSARTTIRRKSKRNRAH